VAGLKCYIAAPWANKADALAAQEQFEAAGLEVTAHWIKHHSDGDTSDDELAEQAVEDVNDIIRSDVFVILNLALSEGKAFEMGVAYTLGIPVVLVGDRTRDIFYHLPNIYRADTVEAAIEGLTTANNLEIVEGSDESE